MSQNPIKCLIVDDSSEDRYRLEKLLIQIGNTSLIGSIASNENPLEFIKLKNPELVFLEVEMKEKTGFELNAKISLRDSQTEAIFVSSSDIYARKALNIGVFGYLVKPVNIIELGAIIRRYNTTYILKKSNY